MDELGITQYRLAVDIGIPHSRVTAIVKCRRAITPDTALRLARYFAISAEFWMNLQNEYDLRKARREHLEEIEAEVKPLVA